MTFHQRTPTRASGDDARAASTASVPVPAAAPCAATYECAPGPIPHQSSPRQYARLWRQRSSSVRAQLLTSYQVSPAAVSSSSASSYFVAWSSSLGRAISPRRTWAAIFVPGSTTSAYAETWSTPVASATSRLVRQSSRLSPGVP
ncbi:hypothetical protein BJF88_00395 [Cellulosimicrobium sp. CUA-896]|nr:hypothetical protein BJF88_00395 [Cellulosimicrobium sp. CUA-896]